MLKIVRYRMQNETHLTILLLFFFPVQFSSMYPSNMLPSISQNVKHFRYTKTLIFNINYVSTTEISALYLT